MLSVIMNLLPLTALESDLTNDEGEQIGWYLARKSNTEPIL